MEGKGHKRTWKEELSTVTCPLTHAPSSTHTGTQSQNAIHTGWQGSQTERGFGLLLHCRCRASCHRTATSAEHGSCNVTVWEAGGGRGGIHFSPPEAPLAPIWYQKCLEMSTCPENGSWLYVMVLGGELNRGATGEPAGLAGQVGGTACPQKWKWHQISKRRVKPN